MVDFLIKRPIAVGMTFLGVVVLGLVAAGHLPISLVPDVDIPRITVHVNAQGYAAEQLEQAIMSPLRNHLMQINRLSNIQTESRDGNGMVHMEFEYGTNVDLAYIEINEQVDRASAALPRDVSRPAVIKASASDIPVFYLDVSYQSDSIIPEDGLEASMAFLELSEFADEIIRRRLEQIPQVAMADMSGRSFPEVVITPNMEKIRAMNLGLEQIESAIRASDLSFGSVFLRDKQYRYNIRVGNQLLGASDIASIQINHQGRLWRLGELCHIETRPQASEGFIHSGNKRAVSMAVIKQADARMQDLKKTLDSLLDHFRADYPHLNFHVYRDQTTLLDYTMENLKQTLLVGAFLAFLVMFAFLRDPRAPWLIIFSVPAALIVSMLFFYLAGISLNVVSVSGLILCIGMMIDNAIIVIDNISRHRGQGKDLHLACVDGTEEVFRPLLSSVLTTCSVFIPLIFLGGLAGALFFDQAMAVSIGLLVSLVIAMTLIPVYYHMLYKKSQRPSGKWAARDWGDHRLYARGFRFAMKKQVYVWILVGLLAAGMPLLMTMMDKQRMPSMQRDASLLWIDWNEHIHVDENSLRNQHIVETVDDHLVYSAIQTGRQQFMLNQIHNNQQQQSLLFLQADSPEAMDKMEKQILRLMAEHYPLASFHFREEGNLFDHLFADNQPPLEIRLKPIAPMGNDLLHNLGETKTMLETLLGEESLESMPTQQSIVFIPDLELMALHQVDMPRLQQTLTSLLNENQILTLMDQRHPMPVKFGSQSMSVEDILATGMVVNRKGEEIPLGLMLTPQRSETVQTIVAGLDGPYHPLRANLATRDVPLSIEAIREGLRKGGAFEATFSGSYFAQKALGKELLVIGLVALMLLFFILAAQFESLRLPVIVLIEVPLALSGALLFLYLAGDSLNIMSMIGMVVMAGIIINDSILKVDTINRLRAGGMGLIRALYTAGHYRLRPILMTSITTICALLPFLFIGGLGGDLQRPLALAVMGGLGLGTLISLYFIPVCYYLLFRNRK